MELYKIHYKATFTLDCSVPSNYDNLLPFRRRRKRVEYGVYLRNDGKGGCMNLIELLQKTRHDQVFSVYVTNIYDQNYPLGKGNISFLLNENECDEMIDHLLDDVDMITVGEDRVLVIRLKDSHFEERLEKQYDRRYTKKWNNLIPESRPYKFSCEMEDFKEGRKSEND